MSDVLRRACHVVVVTAALASTACGTPRATQQFDYGLGGCLVGAGVIGGSLVGTSVIYDPRARAADGSFIAVADQEGVSLWPWGVGIAAIGLGAGGALIAAGAMIDVPDEIAPAARSTTTKPANTAATTPSSDPTGRRSRPREKKEPATAPSTPAPSTPAPSTPAPSTP